MIGRTLGGRYEILEKIDAGGMAYVFKARCKKSDSIVAVKVLKEKFSTNNEYVARFKKEAQAAFSLEHQHIVRVTDVGVDGGVYYIVMEYIEGPSLKTLIDAGGGLSEKQALDYAIQVCSALSAAHKKGIVHRDVKSQNILIDKDGLAKVTDFGIAKSISSEEETDNKVIGSVYYISPEQARGERIDVRSDVYSLGIVMYEMLTGSVPYTGEKTVSVALKHINEQMTPPREKNESVSISASNIVLKATAKTKRSRYRSMDEMKEDLMRALVDKDGEFVDVNLAQPSITNPKNVRKERIWKIAILVAMGVVLALAAVFGADAIRANEPKQLSMPSVVGETSAIAAERLRALGLAIQISQEENDTVPEGVVSAQSPEPGSLVPANQTILLTVSSGPGDLVMPNVYGFTVMEAESVIEDMGLVVDDDYMYEESTELPPGTVLYQVPEADEVVKEGDVVTLVLAQEPVQPAAVMPQVVELPLDQAASLLGDSGFQNIFVYQIENAAEAGVVTAQSPEQGTQAALGSDVDLWISQYTTHRYRGYLYARIEIPEIESKVRIVIEESVGGVLVNFVLQEPVAEVGEYAIDMPINFMYGGEKTVKVYINNKVAYTYQISMTEWNELDEG